MEFFPTFPFWWGYVFSFVPWRVFLKMVLLVCWLVCIFLLLFVLASLFRDLMVGIPPIFADKKMCPCMYDFPGKFDIISFAGKIFLWSSWSWIFPGILRAGFQATSLPCFGWPRLKMLDALRQDFFSWRFTYRMKNDKKNCQWVSDDKNGRPFWKVDLSWWFSFTIEVCSCQHVHWEFTNRKKNMMFVPESISSTKLPLYILIPDKTGHFRSWNLEGPNHRFTSPWKQNNVPRNLMVGRWFIWFISNGPVSRWAFVHFRGDVYIYIYCMYICICTVHVFNFLCLQHRLF